MKTKILFLAGLVATSSILFSCKKDSITTPNNNNNTTVNNGQCTISFSTNKDFGGTTNVNIQASQTTFAKRIKNGSIDQITLQAISGGGLTNIYNAQLVIHVPTGMTTSSTITGDFSLPDGAEIKPILTVSYTTISNPVANGWLSESGSVKITKLTATEIEGTFTGKVASDSDPTGYQLTDGKFYGKF